ncbi:Gut esterase 1 [Toxocara canis]|uniref:Gut esterase 1 n=1 Tax=Toxocara canis TaxID=6265 RepID=A0A0B2W709_TOXCA|nr:Gut esterase 1 [Toxocara canis]
MPFAATEGNLKPINKLLVKPEDYANYGEDDLIEFINGVIAPEAIFGQQTTEVRNRFVQHYVKRDEPDDKNYEFYLNRYTEAKIVGTVSYQISAAMYSTRATHLHEYPYMFGVSPFYDFVVNEDELKLQRAILETFTHFAKYGTPSTEEYPWEPVTAEHPLRHMRFRPESKVQEGFLEENIAFWELMNEYDYDIIRGVRRSHQTGKDEL